MALTHETEAVEKALAALPRRDRGLERIEALVTLLGERAQELEDVVWSLYDDTRLSTAAGAQLDQLGALIGQAREGREDDAYRIWLAVRVALNLSCGTPEDLLKVTGLLASLFSGTNEAGKVHVLEWFPAAVEVQLDTPTTSANALQVLQVLQAAKAAGVRVLLTYRTDPEADVFRFDVGPGFDVGVFADTEA